MLALSLTACEGDGTDSGLDAPEALDSTALPSDPALATSEGSESALDLPTSEATATAADAGAPQGERPPGFARNVTGGKGGSVVRVKSASELAKALCGSQSGGKCTDSTPRIIEVPSQVFDFTGSEGKASEMGCAVKQCTGGQKSELILNRQNWCGQNGKSASMRITYDKAGTTPLLVGSNKTLIGIGPGATIKGKGLTIRGGVRNVIIKNLTITSINPQVVWGGDALTIDEADGVWVDHNKFSLVGRQMLVTGFGKASNVTFSYNEFDGKTPYSATCNGAHYWGMLFLGANDTISMVGNWLHDISGRGPHAGGMQNATNAIHMVNNLFERFPGHALEAYTKTTRLFLEGNYFKQVTEISQKVNPLGYIFAPFEPVSSGVNQQCQSALGRGCVGNVADSSGGKPGTDQAALSAVAKAGPKDALVVPYPARDVPSRVPSSAGPR